MTGPGCFGLLRRAARRRFAAGAAALVAAGLLFALAPGSAAANPQGGHDDEDRDSQSRHELQRLDHVPLILRGGRREDIRRLVVIQARFITISETRFGIDAENLDRVDVSDVPLLGGLFDKPLRAGELTEANRVGTVYSTGNGALAAFIDDDVAVGDAGLSVVNGKYRYTPAAAASQAGSAGDLGELGALPSVQQALSGKASEGTTLVLRGLTLTTVPEVPEKTPALADVPTLRQFFRGSVHEQEHELIFFIRPSIIAGDEE